MQLIDKALQFAARAHKDQFRKGTDIPYISHPAAVGMILQKAGYGEEIIAAGILHDTVEDTTVTLEEINREFGEKVAEIVEGCSEPDKSLSWEERKEHTIEYLKHAPKYIRAAVCADKLHNIQSIRQDYENAGEIIWERFNRGKDQQKWYYTSLVESLGYVSTFKLLKELKREVELLFGMDEARHELIDEDFDVLFGYVYDMTPETEKKLAELKLEKLARELRVEADYLYRSNDYEKIGEVGRFLSNKGINFEQSEGTMILLAFCAELKDRLHLSNTELLRHFKRNLKRGIL